MPSTLFDSAGLAIVAYVQVNGADGSSNSTALANSGVSTTKVPLHSGDYLIKLSTALGQDPSRDLIFVQPTQPTPSTYSSPTSFTAGIPAAIVTDHDDYTKEVQFGSGTTALDCDFNVLVLRTILP
jgi:hypothetical protein